MTGADGNVTIVHRFRTSASYLYPKGFAHFSHEWVFVEMLGYTGVAMPVRYESVPMPALREEKGVPVTIGLVRTK